jgi:hypothetical protein
MNNRTPGVDQKANLLKKAKIRLNQLVNSIFININGIKFSNQIISEMRKFSIQYAKS